MYFSQSKNKLKTHCDSGQRLVLEISPPDFNLVRGQMLKPAAGRQSTGARGQRCSLGAAEESGCLAHPDSEKRNQSVGISLPSV